MDSRKTYILGMAKSSLRLNKRSASEFPDCLTDEDTRALKPGSDRNLELDFLRLAYTAVRLRAQGHFVHAYLMVTTNDLVKKIEKWARKYEVNGGSVQVVSAALNCKELKLLLKEKELNAISNTPDSPMRQITAQADFGKALIETKLKSFIEEKYAGIGIIEKLNMPLFQINWDYYASLVVFREEEVQTGKRT